MNFGNIFIQVAVLFILILVGYMIRKKGLLDEHCTSMISSLVMSIFLPSMIISSMQIEYNPNMAKKIFMLILISIFTYSVSILFSYFLKFIFKSEKNLGVYQYAIIFSNVAFMGYPVIEAVLGKEAIFYTAIFNLPFNVLAYTVGTYLLCKGNEEYSFSLKSLVSPIILSIFIGLILFVFNIRLPEFLNKPIELLGSVTTPISMLVIGSLLANSSALECFSNKKLYFTSFLRLIFLPILVYLILRLKVSDPLLLAIPVVITAMPTAANAAIMANEYGADTTLASQIVFFTTLLSVATIPFICIVLFR